MRENISSMCYIEENKIGITYEINLQSKTDIMHENKKDFLMLQSNINILTHTHTINRNAIIIQERNEI